MSKLLETFQELNLSNYGPDDVDQLNAWAIDAYAELSAIKAQEPVAWAGVIEDCASLFVTEPQLWKAIPLYAAPVSEAKAQGVTDEQAAFEAAVAAVNERGWSTSTDLARQIWDAARIDAADCPPSYRGGKE